MHSTATVSSSIINLVKTIVGSGLLAIPYAFRNDGVLVGICLTLLAAATSGFGLFVLAKCSKTLVNPRNSSFFTLCMLTYPSLSPLFDFAMIVQCFGVGLSYLVLVGDIFPSLFGGNRDAWIIASALIITPLCFLKKLDHLKYSSILGLFALVYLSLLVISMFIKDVLIEHGNTAPTQRGEVYWFEVYDFKGLLSTFSIIIFAYTGAMNLFTIINELKDNSMTNIVKIINGSIIISSIGFLSVGITGYLTFGSNTLGNIMLNYNPDSIFVIFGNFALASMLLLSFPLLFHPLRIACNNLVVWLEINYKHPAQLSEYYGGQVANNVTSTSSGTNQPITLTVNEEDLVDETSTLLTHSPQQDLEQENELATNDVLDGAESPLPGDMEQHTPFPHVRFCWITIALLVSMYALALRITSFALVLALVGATGSTSISFTLPGLFAYKLIGSDSLAVGQMISKRDQFYRKGSILLVIFGISVMILSLYVTLFFGTES
ncbi:vacuolar amino acid transporter 7 [Monosporozyma unispora]|nr:hypothetical protein C6P44_004844 [Kazachstania unispora]